MTLETGRLARFADGCAVAKMGDTSVLVTAVGSTKSAKASFLPLTVDYKQKAAAAGRIPTNHLRKDFTSEKEILVGRVIDRSVRPLFPQWYSSETQVVCNLLAVDGVYDPEVLSINATSAALALSDIPWNGPVGSVRVGHLDGEVIINPTRHQLKKSHLNLIVSATAANKIVMLEGSAEILPKEKLQTALAKGTRAAAKIASKIQDMRNESGKEKRAPPEEPTGPSNTETIASTIKTLAELRVKEIFCDSSLHKFSRDTAVREVTNDVMAKLVEHFPEEDPTVLNEQIQTFKKETFRDLIFERNLRCDGRRLEDLRHISCEVDLYKPLHGSALFQRGQTQVLCTMTYDSPDSAARTDIITEYVTGIKEKNFFLHYEFPPYSVNETGRTTPGRREFGHGALAEKALRPIVPADCPYAVRLTAEVLESNGSSSMASVCAGSLALMDGGVGVSEAAAGVAVGLVTRRLDATGEIQEYKLLTDLLGIEDYMGDMDFKIAGTRTGLTAVQADIKLEGLPLNIALEAVDRGVNGQNKILDIMDAVLSKPREVRKDNAPILDTLTLTPERRKLLLKNGNLDIKRLTAETGVQFTRLDNDAFQMFAPNQTALDEAKQKIEEITTQEHVPDLEFGAIYNTKIVEIRDYGVMVEIHPSMPSILVHNSQLDNRKVSHPSALNLEVGQETMVKYFGRDPTTGQHRMSRKAIFSPASSLVKSLTKKTPTAAKTNNLSEHNQDLHNDDAQKKAAKK